MASLIWSRDINCLHILLHRKNFLRSVVKYVNKLCLWTRWETPMKTLRSNNKNNNILTLRTTAACVLAVKNGINTNTPLKYEKFTQNLSIFCKFATKYQNYKTKIFQNSVTNALSKITWIIYKCRKYQPPYVVSTRSLHFQYLWIRL